MSESETNGDEAEYSIQDDGTIVIDRSPEGHADQASQCFSGEVMTEYGIIDIHQTYPCQGHTWKPEYPPSDLPGEAIEDHPDLDQDSRPMDVSGNIEERRVVVPVTLVRRGLKNNRSARSMAETMNENSHGRRYFPVLLSDSRGL